MYDVLEEGAEKIVMAHPKRVKAIAAAKVKTDKIDATILAHLARADLLPTAYVPPTEIRELRDLVRHRSKLVRDRTRYKNRVHYILSRYNLHSPCSDLFGKKGRAFLVEVRGQLSSTHQLILEFRVIITKWEYVVRRSTTVGMPGLEQGTSSGILGPVVRGRGRRWVYWSRRWSQRSNSRVATRPATMLATLARVSRIVA
jgi:transposase